MQFISSGKCCREEKTHAMELNQWMVFDLQRQLVLVHQASFASRDTDTETTLENDSRGGRFCLHGPIQTLREDPPVPTEVYLFKCLKNARASGNSVQTCI